MFDQLEVILKILYSMFIHIWPYTPAWKPLWLTSQKIPEMRKKKIPLVSLVISYILGAFIINLHSTALAPRPVPRKGKMKNNNAWASSEVQKLMYLVFYSKNSKVWWAKTLKKKISQIEDTWPRIRDFTWIIRLHDVDIVHLYTFIRVQIIIPCTWLPTIQMQATI